MYYKDTFYDQLIIKEWLALKIKKQTLTQAATQNCHNLMVRYVTH